MTDYVEVNSLKQYFNEMSQIPLLSVEEEQELAKRMADGDIGAKNKMIEANLRLVVSIARKFQGLGIPFQDLLQEGNIGLLKATEKYELERGYRFATYATYCIRQYILRAVSNKGRMMRLPVHVTEDLYRLKRISRELTVKLGREPKTIELAKEMDMSEKEVKKFLTYFDDVSSLDVKVGESEDDTVGSLVEDTSFKSIAAQMDDQDVNKIINEVLDTLDGREADIIRYRYGINGGRSYSLEEIGGIYGLTRERVRQLEAKAMRKLRMPIRANAIKEAFAV